MADEGTALRIIGFGIAVALVVALIWKCQRQRKDSE